MWEWRAFASTFDLPDDLLGPDVDEERRVDSYVVAPGLGVDRGLKLRGGSTLELKVREAAQGALELWRKPVADELEVPPWRTRELARLLAPGAPVPVRPLRALDDLLRLVRDLHLGEPRVVVVAKAIVSHTLDAGVRVERAALSVEGRALETVAVEGADPDAVRAAVSRLVLPGDARVASYPAWLAGA